MGLVSADLVALGTAGLHKQGEARRGNILRITGMSCLQSLIKNVGLQLVLRGIKRRKDKAEEVKRNT
jgi:hypothetical protein